MKPCMVYIYHTNWNESGFVTAKINLALSYYKGLELQKWATRVASYNAKFTALYSIAFPLILTEDDVWYLTYAKRVALFNIPADTCRTLRYGDCNAVVRLKMRKQYNGQAG